MGLLTFKFAVFPRSCVPQSRMNLLLSVINVVVSISSTYMSISPTTAMYRIHKHKSTGLASVVPLAALWFCNNTWMMYGILKGVLFPLIITNAVGSVFSIGYLMVFYQHTMDKRFVLFCCLIALMTNTVVATYAMLGKALVFGQALETVTDIVGYIGMTSSFMLYASPFIQVAQVLKTKTSESIPILMSTVGTLNNLLWIIYAYLAGDNLILIPSTVNFSFGVLQIILFILYHPRIQGLNHGIKNFNTVTLGAIQTVSSEVLEAIHPLKQGELIFDMIAPSVIVPVETNVESCKVYADPSNLTSSESLDTDVVEAVDSTTSFNYDSSSNLVERNVASDTLEDTTE